MLFETGCEDDQNREQIRESQSYMHVLSHVQSMTYVHITNKYTMARCDRKKPSLAWQNFHRRQRLFQAIYNVILDLKVETKHFKLCLPCLCHLNRRFLFQGQFDRQQTHFVSCRRCDTANEVNNQFIEST